MRQRKYKKCPRCDHKVPFGQDVCDGCGLIFSRLSKTSNRAAKKYLKQKQYNKVIMDKMLPRDVNKWKLFLWGLFLGWFGVHYAKVGRYKMFTWAIISAASIYIALLLPESWFYHRYLFFLMYGLTVPAAIYFVFYVVSVFQIAFGKFKVPIAIDEEYVKSDLDRSVVNSILQEVKKDNKPLSNKARKKNKIRVVCASCGAVVKVFEEDEICPKCNEPLKED